MKPFRASKIHFVNESTALTIQVHLAENISANHSGKASRLNIIRIMFSSQITIHWHETFIIWCSLSKHVAKVHRCTHFVLQLHNIATDEILCLRYGFFYRLRCHFLSLFSMHNLNKECISKLDLSVDPHIYFNLPGSNAVVFIVTQSLNGSTTS